jgi:hypothetical protein
MILGRLYLTARLRLSSHAGLVAIQKYILFLAIVYSRTG